MVDHRMRQTEFQTAVREEGKALFHRLLGLTTEARNPRTSDLDLLEPKAILERINDEDARVALAVRQCIPEITRAVEIVTQSLSTGGRLLYVGAGTSGRLGVLDAAECPPTFGTPRHMIRGLMAGGATALVQAVEGAEDDPEAAPTAMDALGISGNDVVVGVAASWRTPYTVAGVRHARERGAATIYITTNPPERVEVEVDVLIAPQVGPEAIMGSTRMKSGTAQKLVLNMITTATMVRLGKIYENMMVDLMATSEKLKERSKRVLMMATGIDYDEAVPRLEAAGGNVKLAIVMTLADVDRTDAERALDGAEGHVRRALDRLGERT